MEIKEFERFVASQQEPGTNATTDWAEVRDEWLRNLDSLYVRITKFLEEYVPGSITYTFAEIELIEPNIGKYSAKRMDIKIGRQRVSLTPIGTLLIACKGRVDAQGSAGRAQILLVDKRTLRTSDLIKITETEGTLPLSGQEPITWDWKIVSNQRTFVELDRESFFELLMEIANA